jgi:hypothetical protein
MMVRARKHRARFLQPQLEHAFGQARAGLLQQPLEISRRELEFRGKARG